MNKFGIISLIMAFALFIVFKTPVFAEEAAYNPQAEPIFASGKVLEIVDIKENKELSASFQSEQMVQTVKVLVLNGKYKGQTILIENNLTANPAYDINIKPGQRVVLSIDDAIQPPTFFIADIERYPVLMIILGVFLGLLLLVGGMKGMYSIISLGTTALLVFFVLVPAILNNYPPIPSAIVVALVSTFITMVFVGGVNLKSLAASLGTVLSVLAAGIIAMLAIHFAVLNGFHDQESTILLMERPELNFTSILAAAVIIGALGAVMDVGMSIASSIYELKSVNNSLTPAELFKSGMNVGRDTMGTMANTLILAYVGGAFSLILLAANAPVVKLINLGSVATEIVAALAGSIGIVVCVPVTAVIAGYLIGNSKEFKGACVCENKPETALR